MPIMDMVMAALKFDKDGLSNTANNENDTLPAMLLIFAQSIVALILALITGESTSPVSQFSGDVPLSGFLLGVGDLVITLLMTLLLGWLLSVVLRMFGGQSGTMQVLRIVGATSIWGTIGTILSFTYLGWIFSLLGFIALLIGISSYSGKGVFMVIIAIIVTYILLTILVVFLVVGIIFAALAA